MIRWDEAWGARWSDERDSIIVADSKPGVIEVFVDPRAMTIAEADTFAKALAAAVRYARSAVRDLK